MASMPERAGLTRRSFLKAGCGLFLGGAASCALGAVYSSMVEPSWVETTQTELALPSWPGSLDGLTIAHLSDLHLGPYVSLEYVRACVARVNALQADLALLTGDFVYAAASYSATCAQELKQLRATLGTYAVLGNHDIWNGADEVAGNLMEAGIHLLRGSMAEISLGDCSLWLLGVEDTGFTGGSFGDFRAFWQERADGLWRMLAEIPPQHPRLLLVHNPDFAEMLPPGRIDLALCGHTHGGQVCLPLIGPLILPSSLGMKYASGLVAGPSCPVYVSRGIGLIPPPVRLNCRPEIALLRLRSA
jgi:predicted MPP superfamily phosphohydrolase